MSGIQVGPRVPVPAAHVRPTTSPARRVHVGRLLGAIALVALIAALALVAFIGAGIVGNPWYHVVAIEGGSMEPTLTRGDLIIVTPPPQTVEPGVILVMGVGDRVVTHRVVAVRPDGSLVTQGDANRIADDWQGMPITILGEYRFAIPALGHLLPTGNASGAWFSDEVTASATITVGTFEIPEPPPTPPECADMEFAQVIVGTPGDDQLVAGNGGALVFGLGGSDTLDGGNGRDCLVGGEGNDILVGGNGKDVLLGGDGDDTLHGGGDGDVVEGGNGKDLLDGGDGIDACYGTNKDVFKGCETVAEESTTPVPAPVDLATPTAEEPPGGTPVPTTEPTPDGTAPVPEPTPAPVDPTPTIEPTLAPVDPTGTPEPTSTPVDPTPTPEPTIEPPPVPTPEPTIEPTPKPKPKPKPTADPTSTPVSTPAPEPTSTPVDPT